MTFDTFTTLQIMTFDTFTTLQILTFDTFTALQILTFDIGGVEDVPNGRPDLLECGDKETSHGVRHQSQHAL